MHSEKLVLDVRKPHEATEKIHLRRGEKGMTSIDAEIKDGAMAFDLTGCSVFFKAMDRMDRYVLGSARVTSMKEGKVSYVVGTNLTSLPGEVKLAYFEIVSDGNNITTPAIPIIVLENVDLTGDQADEYESQISELIRLLEDSVSNANIATTHANDAAAEANKAAKRAEDSADANNTAAARAENAASWAESAGNSANEASQRANTAATAAEAITETATQAAWEANEATTRANEAADRVDETIDAANEATQRANEAADRTDESILLATEAAGEASMAASVASANNERTRVALESINEALDSFVTITGSDVAYTYGTSPVVPPEEGWAPVPQPLVLDEDVTVYEWTRVITRMSDGTSTVSYSVARQGKDGRDGIAVESSSLYWLWVNDVGDLYATYADRANPPSFDYQSDTGNLYVHI